MKEKKNLFSKILIIGLICFIILLIWLSFVYSKESFVITSGIVVCLSFIIILALSESFDNFSIGKLLTLSKNNKQIKSENERLKNENFKLISQMINIKNNNNQNVSINLEGSRNIEDINSNNSDINEDINSNNSDINESIEEEQKFKTFEELRKERIERHRLMRAMEVCLLKKELSNVPQNAETQYEVKVISNEMITDDIMKNDLRFDAFSRYGKNNIFYEIKTSAFLWNVFELYYKIRLVQIYGEKNNTNSKLVLILPKFDEKLKEKMMERQLEIFDRIRLKINDVFEPAISNGLLVISNIEISLQELEDYLKEKEEKCHN